MPLTQIESASAAIGGFNPSDTEQLQLLLEILGWTAVLADSVDALGLLDVKVAFFNAASDSINCVVAAAQRNHRLQTLAIFSDSPTSHEIPTELGFTIHFIHGPLDLELIEKLIECAS